MGAKMGGGGGGSRYVVEQNADINVTPFVDIMLVLLIIFMVSIPLATVSIKLDMPPALPSEKKPEEPTFIQIQTNGEIFIKSDKTTLDALPAQLAAALGGPNPQEELVYVKAQADVEYDKFMEVLNRLQDSGFFKIGLINEDIT